MKSIRSRLLLLLLPPTAAALLLAAIGIDRAVYRDLGEARDRRLLLLARGIGSAVDIEIDGSLEFELEDADMEELREAARDAFYAVAAEDGSILFSSGEVPVELFEGMGEETYRDVRIDGEEVRAAVIAISRDPRGDEEDVQEWLEGHPGEGLPEAKLRRLRVAAAGPDHDLEATMLLVRRRLVAGFGLLCVLLISIPVAATSLSLSSLSRLSDQAERIDADNPGARLDDRGVDREVVSLVVAVNRALERMGLAYDQQKRFTADAAHELRSPLSAIRAQCEVGLRKDRESGELKDVLESVQRTTLRLSKVVENLLSLSRLQHGGLVMERRPVDLADTAGEAMSLLAPLAESKGIRLKAEIGGPVSVSGDGGLLLECLSLLIDNAIRYTPEGGLITVRTGNGKRPRFSVSDTGIGICEEHLDRIFERFYRVEPSRSGTEGGSGLGLSIAEAIALIHGAEITVVSTPGEGSLFTLSFPK